MNLIINPVAKTTPKNLINDARLGGDVVDREPFKKKPSKKPKGKNGDQLLIEATKFKYHD